MIDLTLSDSGSDSDDGGNNAISPRRRGGKPRPKVVTPLRCKSEGDVEPAASVRADTEAVDSNNGGFSGAAGDGDEGLKPATTGE